MVRMVLEDMSVDSVHIRFQGAICAIRAVTRGETVYMHKASLPTETAVYRNLKLKI
jgi:hypothetical protein